MCYLLIVPRSLYDFLFISMLNGKLLRVHWLLTSIYMFYLRQEKKRCDRSSFTTIPKSRGEDSVSFCQDLSQFYTTYFTLFPLFLILILAFFVFCLLFFFFLPLNPFQFLPISITCHCFYPECWSFISGLNVKSVLQFITPCQIDLLSFLKFH